MRWVLITVVVWRVWLSPSAGLAHAGPAEPASDTRVAAPALTFAWHAPASCPARDDVLARVEHLLGHAPESTLAAPLSIDATVSELTAESWELRLVSGETNAEPRRVIAASCAELAEMAAVFTALSIDPTLNVAPADTSGPAPETSGREQQGPAAQQPGAAPAAETPSASAPTLPPRAPVRRSASPDRLAVRPVVAAFAALGFGRLPGAAAGFGAEGGISSDRLGVRALIAYFPERHAAASTTSGADLSLGMSGARAIYALTEGAAIVALSAGVTLGWMHGTGAGVTRPASGDALLLGLEPGARAGYALSSHFALLADVTLSVPLNRPRFVLAGAELYRPPLPGAQLGLSAEWHP